MRSNRLRRAASIVALVAAALTTVAGAPAAGADEPAVSVSPRAVYDGATVTVSTTGIEGETDLYGYFQCPASIVGTTDPSELGRSCRSLAVGSGPFPTAVTGTVARRIGAVFPQTDCTTVAGGCVVGVHVILDDLTSVARWTAITFEPDAVAAPRVGLADGDTITVSARGLAGAGATVAQCTSTYAANTGFVDRDTGCGPAVALADAGADSTATMVVHEPFLSVRGDQSECRYRGCALVVATSAASHHAVLPISFGPPALTAPAGPHADGAEVTVALDGIVSDEAVVRQCSTDGARCTTPRRVLIDGAGSADLELSVVRTFTSGGTTVDCAPSSCSIVAEVDGEVVASTPISFLAPALAVAPDTGLLDGHQVMVTLSGAEPTSIYPLYRCGPGDDAACDLVGPAFTDTAGNATVAATVAHRPDAVSICRDDCSFRVVAAENLVATYAMAAGAASVSPATGLADGQTVQVSATDMQPTYPGRAFGPFLSGVAAVAQCSVSFEQSPNLFTYFDGCATTAIPLTITDPDLEVDLPVHTSVTTFTGRQIDCSEPGACSAGVVRFDQDGSMTGHMTPLAFDG